MCVTAKREDRRNEMLPLSHGFIVTQIAMQNYSKAVNPKQDYSKRGKKKTTDTKDQGSQTRLQELIKIQKWGGKNVKNC